MTAIVTQGDAAHLHLPDASVDLVVTSPPYFGLRSYTDGGQHYQGQVGAEATPAEYLDALIACTTEWMRVLKLGGSIFVNLGDKYSTGNSGQSGMAKLGEQYRGGGHTQAKAKTRSGRVEGMAPKSLIGLPWRYAIRCIDDLGLILRAEIVWAKPNGLPESVTDRVRRSHEQVFHFVKQPRYFSAVDEVREPHLSPVKPGRRHEGAAFGSIKTGGDGSRHTDGNPLGKLPGSVWTIPTSPLRVPESLGIDHFAAYPPDLVRRIILGWSPREVCTACGEGRRPVVDKVRTPLQRVHTGPPLRTHSASGGAGDLFSPVPHATTATITGYACACPDTTAPTTPSVVLDPFAGTGTTMLVASVHGRVGIGVDLSADYCRLAQWRTTDEKQRAKAAALGKPHKQPKAAPAPVIDLPTATLFDNEATA